MRARKIWAVSLALACFFLAGAKGAWGHKLLVAAVTEADGALKVLVFFPDGSPAKEVPVVIIPEGGGPRLEAKTDVQGACKVARLGPGNYRLEAGDPLGHQAETRVAVAGGPAAAAPMAEGSGDPARLREALPWGNILAGLGFIFGVAAFLMVFKLRREVRRHASRD